MGKVFQHFQRPGLFLEHTKMRTNEKTPKAVTRLAEQLGMTPEELTAKALENGLRQIDWNLANDCDPLSSGCDMDDDLNVTAVMDSLPKIELKRLARMWDTPQHGICEENFVKNHGGAIVAFVG